MYFEKYKYVKNLDKMQISINQKRFYKLLKIKIDSNSEYIKHYAHAAFKIYVMDITGYQDICGYSEKKKNREEIQFFDIFELVFC